MLANKLMGASTPDKTYIEDVFSIHLYTGNGSTQTINNGIDLAGKGGMVWTKSRTYNYGHQIYTTTIGTGSYLRSNTANGNTVTSGAISSFNSNGFTLGPADDSNGDTVGTGVSWTFRKAPKFFDVVTYTGDGVAGRTINHNLGQAPGMIIVKCTSTTGNWAVYHRSHTSASYYTKLNLTDPQASDTTVWNGTHPTDTVFSVGTSALTNTNGATYVAYLFAHDTTTDGLIRCGSFTTDGSGNATVDLGWEPQYILYKRTNNTAYWCIQDIMRGFSATSASSNCLFPNGANAEGASGTLFSPTSTGFTVSNGGATAPYIYMAIRRGPMRTPTDATKVFQPVTYTGTLTTEGQSATIQTSITPDLVITKPKNGDYSTTGHAWYDRVRSENGKFLISSATWAEADNTIASTYGLKLNAGMNSIKTVFSAENNGSGSTYVAQCFKRAPGFFDVVCYTGNGVAGQVVNHNLGVKPDLIIYKRRNEGTLNWQVQAVNTLGHSSNLTLNTSNQNYSNGTTYLFASSNSTSITTGTNTTYVNEANGTYVAYLFASCPGVSKVGSYTGNGSSQTINCGFSAGARFVLIKRIDSTGDWYVWDTARGIVASNDPHLSLNVSNAEITTDDTIDPDSTGFIVNQVTATNVNVSGGSYIYLAIA